MPNGFENKDYGDYFKTLEENLNKPQKRKIPEPEPQKERAKLPKLNKKTGRTVLAVFLAAVIVTVSVCVVSAVNKNEPEIEDDTVSQPAETKEDKVEKIS